MQPYGAGRTLTLPRFPPLVDGADLLHPPMVKDH